MTSRGKSYLGAVILVVVIGLTVAWAATGFETTMPRTYRYRLTLTVDTPEGERSGSSVVEMKTSFPGGLMRADGWAIWTTVNGEATMVDLGSRGLLFTTFAKEEELKSGRWGYFVGLTPFPLDDFLSKSEKELPYQSEYAVYLDKLKQQKPKGILIFDKTTNELPMLVRFRDLKDPASVERVDPYNLAASFGPGVSFKSATIQITDDPVTTGIDKVLPWLGLSDVSPSLFPPPKSVNESFNAPVVKGLRYDDFRRLGS